MNNKEYFSCPAYEENVKAQKWYEFEAEIWWLFPCELTKHALSEGSYTSIKYSTPSIEYCTLQWISKLNKTLSNHIAREFPYFN